MHHGHSVHFCHAVFWVHRIRIMPVYFSSLLWLFCIATRPSDLSACWYIGQTLPINGLCYLQTCWGYTLPPFSRQIRVFSILELFETLKHVITVLNMVKYAELGLVIAGKKHSAKTFCALRDHGRADDHFIQTKKFEFILSLLNFGILIFYSKRQMVNLFHCITLGTSTLLLIAKILVTLIDFFFFLDSL